MKRIILGLAAVAALGACSGSGGGGGPGATVQEFTRKMDGGECVGLREYISSSTREMLGEKIEQGCTMGVEQRKKAGNSDQTRLKSVNILEEKEEGERATVRAEFENNAGQKEGPQTFVLVREEGRWRIDLLATGQMNRGAGGGGGSGGMAPGGAAPAPMPAPGAAPTAPAPADGGEEAPAPEPTGNEAE